MRKMFTTAAAFIAGALPAAPAVAATGQLVKTNCAPVAAFGGVMVFNTRQANGLWDVRVGDASCNGTAPLPAYDGHRGATDLSPDGRYVLLTTAYGAGRASAVAEPGKGVGNDLELFDRSTGTLRRLTTGRSGIIWAKFKPDMTRVVWSELVAGGGWFPWDNDYLGSWALHVATLDPATGALTGERVWTPPSKAFVETYGWLPGTNRIVFDSDSGIGQQEGGGWVGHWFASQLQTIPDDLSTAPVRLSPPLPVTAWDWGCWCNRTTPRNIYHEFAHFNGDGRLYTSIAYGVKDGTPQAGSMDLWSYRPDGTDLRRVSYLAGDADGRQVAGFPPPKYVVVGGMAWIDGAWIAGVAGDAQAKTIDAYRIVP